MGAVGGAAQEFIEVTVRVPVVRGTVQGRVGLTMEDIFTREDIAGWMAEEYPTVAGFLFDWFDAPGSKTAVRISWAGQDGYEEVWRADGSPEASANS